MARTGKKLDPISIRLDPEVKAALEVIAKEDDRSLAWVINRILREHLDNAGKKPLRK